MGNTINEADLPKEVQEANAKRRVALTIKDVSHKFLGDPEELHTHFILKRVSTESEATTTIVGDPGGAPMLFGNRKLAEEAVNDHGEKGAEYLVLALVNKIKK